MPVNSFEHYPMTWKPDRAALHKPVYRSLAKLLEEAIVSGRLPPNTRLPPQRELADYLDLNLSTVTQAFAICEARGLLYGITGKGTFVAHNRDVENTVYDFANGAAVIDLATIQPFEQTGQAQVRACLESVLNYSKTGELLSYKDPFGTFYHRSAARGWLENWGISCAEDDIYMTSGIQHALSVILLSVFQAGDKIAVDEYTYANFISLAKMRGIKLVPVKSDSNGILPGSLEKMVQTEKPRGLYLIPSCNNPSNTCLDMRRRMDIARIITGNRMILIEDDVYAFLLPACMTPISALAPGQSFYLCGLSKSICSGLRVGYAVCPASYRTEMERGMINTNLKTSSFDAEVMTELIRSGAARKIIAKKVSLAQKRNAVFDQVFRQEASGKRQFPVFSHWLELPDGFTGADLEGEAKKRGVRVWGSERFFVGKEPGRSYLRVASCSARDEKQLKEGLDVLSRLIGRSAQDQREETAPDSSLFPT
ncbi:MAG: GntR family transcriptional regulator [Paenibacillaceae bacterium]|jgi:DNA-binding transcriptional MocR family regulator|nr:GntR family transcriptional regulator [Paenibacillaceae bacterium]